MNRRFRLLAGRLLRYATVSAICSIVSLTVLGVLVWTGMATAGWANVIATAVGTVPSFELNRRWVWGKTGRRSLWAEVGPYCALSFSGLVLSTVAVSVASRWATASGWGVDARTLVAECANIATFGALWIAQYRIADRLLFRPPASAGPVAPVVACAGAGEGGRVGGELAASAR